MRRLLALIGLLVLAAGPAFATACSCRAYVDVIGRMRTLRLGAARDLTPNTRLVAQLSVDRMQSERLSWGVFPRRNVFTASIGVVRHWSNSPLRSRP